MSPTNRSPISTSKIGTSISPNNNPILMESYCSSNSISSANVEDEWVEIIEPKSKTKIYANLESGICAKNPPPGAKVSRSEDFSDHWWELYDHKTGKFYYYNPERQKTAWTKPTQPSSSNCSPSNGSSNGSSGDNHTSGTGPKNGKAKRLLIIPVSRLQTYRSSQSPSLSIERNTIGTNTHDNIISSKSGQVTYSDQQISTNLNFNSRIVKCDASTQTSSAHLVSIGTQTTTHDLQQQKPHRNADTHQASTDESYQIDKARRDEMDRDLRQVEQKFDSLLYRNNVQGGCGAAQQVSSLNQHLDYNDHEGDLGEDIDGVDDGDDFDDDDDDEDEEDDDDCRSNNLHDDTISVSNASRECDSSEGWKSPSSFNSTDHARASNSVYQGPPSTPPPPPPVSRPPPPVRSMQNQHSTKNDTISMQHQPSKTPMNPLLNLSNEEKNPVSFRSQELDNRKLIENFRKSRQTSSFGTTGHDGSLGRASYKVNDSGASSEQPINSSVGQRIKNVADTYLHAISDKQNKPPPPPPVAPNFDSSQLKSSNNLSNSNSQNKRNLYKAAAASTERHLRQLSTLSTLPRPRKETKDKIALSKQDTTDLILSSRPQLASNIDHDSPQLDADYDVVEENCNVGYHSDSEQSNVGPKQLTGGLLSSMANQVTSKIASSFNPVSNNNCNDSCKLSENLSSSFDRNTTARSSTFSVEMFARENLARHPKKGGLLFNRKIKLSRMISWTKSSIKHPMISSVSSDLTQDAISSFKLIQQYMGDREVTMNKKYRQLVTLSHMESSASSSSSGLGANLTGNSLDEIDKLDNSSNSCGLNTSNNSSNSQNITNVGQAAQYSVPDRLRDELAYELVLKGCTTSALRDEIYIQMARQLTENPSQESTRWGFILLSILFCYFSPSSKFSPFLKAFLESHQNQIARDICLSRLERRLRQNWLTYCRKPSDGREISMVRLSITKWPQSCGLFGESPDKIMSMQTCSTYLQSVRLPWILTTLGKKLLETGGDETEGIFRCAADHDLLAQLRLELDCVDFKKITDAQQLSPMLSGVQDPHVIAGLLKLFFRQLPEPIFPSHLYDLCLQSSQDAGAACRIFEELPNLNKDIVAYLIHLLQKLCKSDKVVNTKMDESNLAMIWAPNLLRAPPAPAQTLEDQSSISGSKWSISNWGVDEQQQQIPSQSQAPHLVGSGNNQSSTCTLAPSQTMIFEQTRQEMHFLRLLIVNLETSFIENVV